MHPWDIERLTVAEFDAFCRVAEAHRKQQSQGE